MTIEAKLVVACEEYKYVVFLEDEILEVDLDKPFVKRMKKELKKKLKDEGVGALDRWLQPYEYWSTYGEKFYGMDVEEIMELHPDVYRIAYSEIKLVSLKGLIRDGSYHLGATEERLGSLFVEGKKESIIVDHRHSRTSDTYRAMVRIFGELGLDVEN